MFQRVLNGATLEVLKGWKKPIFITFIIVIAAVSVLHPATDIAGEGQPGNPVQAAESGVAENVPAELLVERVMACRDPAGAVCTAVAEVSNPLTQMVMEGGICDFMVTDETGRQRTGTAELGRLEPGQRTFVICPYIPAPGGKILTASVNVRPRSWKAGAPSAQPFVEAPAASSERCTRGSGYKGFLLHARGTLNNESGGFAKTVRLSVVLLDASGAMVAAEEVYLYDVPAGTRRDFLFQLSGIQPSHPGALQVAIAARVEPS
ncbi:MAG: hypothetical protein ACYC55_00160 [Candidatus Geothermincolia bacterium]